MICTMTVATYITDWINIDHQYTYIIWTGKQDMWVSCWDNYSNRNVFVLKPEKIISKGT